MLLEVLGLNLISVAFAWFALALAAARPSPPKPAKKPHRTHVHGRDLRDDYHWLRERANPETLAHLEAENAYTAAVMRPTEKLQETLYREMRGRIQETDVSAPYRLGDYFYYHRTEEGAQYALRCRKRGSLEAPEELLLDENRMAEGKPYFRLGAFEVSPDHRLLAFSTDETGDEKYTIRIKDLSDGRLLPDRIPETAGPLVWANDNRTLFYTALDAAHRPDRALRHVLGTEATADKLVFREPDELFFVFVDATRSRRFLLIGSESKTSSEIRFLDADNPFGPWRVVEPRRPRVEYSLDHRGDLFYIVTNDQAVNFRLMTAPVENPGRSNWEERIAHREDVRLLDAAAFRDHLAVFERSGGIRTIRVLDFATESFQPVRFDEEACTATPGPNPEFDTRLLRIHYSSLVTPPSVYDFDMASGALELKKRIEVLGGYDASRYNCQRLAVAAADGVSIPVSLVYKKPLRRDGRRPLYLYGYGAYGICIDPTFSSNRLSLLDRGVAIAIAHVRGGEDLGRRWYEQGKLLNKKNTFEDFIACAEHLIREGYTSPDRLAISGGSAGGLLIGATLNLRPDLFRAAAVHVPFVDVVNTMLDPTLPLTVTEYEEWGDPNQKEAFEYILSYSPYENVRAQDYPAILATAGLNDPRVAYWEPAKWVARLRDLKTDSHPVLLKTNLGAGHGGASGRFDRLREVALDYAFVLTRLGRGNGGDVDPTTTSTKAKRRRG